jgi:hypothetical protein
MAWAITGSNSLIVRNSQFRGNIGAGIRKGPQIHTGPIEDCLFEENVGLPALPAVTVTTGPITIQRCLFINNTSADDCSALRWQSATGTIRMNTFWNNTTAAMGENGSAIEMLSGGTVTFEQNVIAGSGGAPSAMASGGTNVNDSCNLFWDNADGDVVGFVADASTEYSDPIFCDPSGGDFSVASDSPCVTSEECAPIGGFGEGCVTVSVEPETWSTIKARFRR